MPRLLLQERSSLTVRIRSMRRRVRHWLRRLAIYDAYRPELHYMRGRGPKWQEKYQSNKGTVIGNRPEAGAV